MLLVEKETKISFVLSENFYRRVDAIAKHYGRTVEEQLGVWFEENVETFETEYRNLEIEQ